MPAGQTLSEDTSLTFSSANGNSLTVSDSHEDAASGSLTTSLQVSAGTLSLSGTAGLAFTAGDGTADTSMTFQGTPDSLNVALAGMTYQPDADFSGEVTLTIGTTDSGDVGTGVSPLRDTDTLSVSVTAVNDPPTLTVPAAQILAEEGTLTFSTANAFGITDDASDSSASIEVQLTVSSGTVKLSQTTGLTVTSGADSTATVTFQGQVSAALAAMEGLAYMPPAGFSGSDQLQVRINDQGSTGAGEAKEVTATVDITVTPTNDPPVSTVPAGQTFSEDTPLIFSSASSNSLSVSDTEEVAASGNLAVAIQVTDGVLTLSGTAGLTFTSGDGTADASMAFNGTPDSLNAAMEGASFTPDVGYSGEVTLTLATTDGGDIGTGANPLTETDTVLLTVQAHDRQLQAGRAEHEAGL